MSAWVLLLCVVASIAGLCECLSLMRNLSPPRETSSTTLRLTAQRNDTGSWTTKFGDYNMTIEHKHFNILEDDQEDGTWTLKVKHTTTIFEDKPNDEMNEHSKPNSLAFENKPEDDDEEREDDLQNWKDFNEVQNVKSEEDRVSNFTEVAAVYEAVPEKRTEENVQHIAMRYEANPEDERLDLEESRPAYKKVEEEGVSMPDRKTVLQILEQYRNSDNNNEADNSESYGTLEVFPASELASTATTVSPFIIEEAPNVIEERTSPTRRTFPDFGKMTSEEREHYNMKEERKQIMDRYPRSRALDPASLGYSFHSGVGWLKLNTAHWQWDVARKSCQADGAHLAVPDTLFKIRTFIRILKDNSDVIERAVLKNQVFVGVYDPNNNRRFTTVTGEAFIPESVSIWFPNEPNDADPGEDCVTLHLEGKLRDVPCFFNLPFICQIDEKDTTVTI